MQFPAFLWLFQSGPSFMFPSPFRGLGIQVGMMFAW